MEQRCNSAESLSAASCLLVVTVCEQVHEVLLRVMHMLDPPARFMEPAILGKVLRHLLTAPFRNNKAATDHVGASTLLSGSSSSSSKTASSAGAASAQAVAAVRSSVRGGGRFDMGVNI
jgi:hypothetical protein